MRKISGAALMIAVMSLLALNAGSASADDEKKPARPDWGNWSTWHEAKKGEWVQYVVGPGVQVRYEVNSFEGGIVNYQHISFLNGEETGNRERKLAPARCPLAKPSRVDPVKWTTGTVKIGDVEINCDIASWTSGRSVQEIWYSKDVPCGGVVRQTFDGKANVWLVGFHSEATGEVKGDSTSDPNESATETQPGSSLPAFFQHVDNSMLLRISVGDQAPRWQIRRVTAVEETSSRVSAVFCMEDGSEIPGMRANEIEQKQEDWEKEYGKPTKQGEKVKVPAGEFVCDYFERPQSAGEMQVWLTPQGVLVKQVITRGESKTIIELVKLTMQNEKKEEADAEPGQD